MEPNLGLILIKAFKKDEVLGHMVDGVFTPSGFEDDGNLRGVVVGVGDECKYKIDDKVMFNEVLAKIKKDGEELLLVEDKKILLKLE